MIPLNMTGHFSSGDLPDFNQPLPCSGGDLTCLGSTDNRSINAYRRRVHNVFGVADRSSFEENLWQDYRCVTGNTGSFSSRSISCCMCSGSGRRKQTI